MKIKLIIHDSLVHLLTKNLKKKNETPNPTELFLELKEPRSLKDIIQSIGIPHTEVGRILHNSEEVNISLVLRDNSTFNPIEIFPATTSPSRDNPPRFICDVHLSKLARRLRFLSFDTLCSPEWDDEKQAEISNTEDRIMLTGDKGLLMRNTIKEGLLIRNNNTEKQVEEVIRRLNVSKFITLFTRCMICNCPLTPINTASEFFKSTIEPQIPPKVLKWNQEFKYCPSCGKIYWKGTHYKRLKKLMLNGR